MLCNKIFENPRKGFLQSLDQGKNKIKKRIFFHTLFCPQLCHGIFLPPVPEIAVFWATLVNTVHCQCRVNTVQCRVNQGCQIGILNTRFAKTGIMKSAWTVFGIVFWCCGKILGSFGSISGILKRYVLNLHRLRGKIHLITFTIILYMKENFTCLDN